MKILKLQAENVKKLTAVEITPDGSVVVVGGKNRAGKSSVLDSIVFALAGKRAIAEKPLRKGAKSGKIVIETDGDAPLHIERTFTDDGKSQLEIKSKEGYRAPSPQTILDDLCADGVAFDPLAFVRKKPSEQAEMLRELVGLDFTAHDREYKRIYDERTILNRQGMSLKTRIDGMTKYPDVPKEEVSVSELLTELKNRQAVNLQNHKARHGLDIALEINREMHGVVDTATKDVEAAEMALANARQRLANATARATADDAALNSLKKSVESLQDVSEDPIQEQIATAEDVNEQVRANGRVAHGEAELEELRQKSADMTAQLKRLDEAKAEQMAAAKWPVEGLGFDASGVTFNGLPFSQASSAESLEVAFAMGISKCPDLRVFIIRDGALLDEDTLPRVCKMAEDHDIQLWIERVGTGEECSVIIEDGHVREPEPVGAEA